VGKLIWILLKIYCSLQQWKNFANRSRIDKIIAMDRVAPFFDSQCRVPCSNAAKTRKPMKFVGVPQTRQQISAVSKPKFTILWEHVVEISMFNKIFFPIVDTCLSCENTARQSCAMVQKWQFLRLVFSESRVQHISDMHSKFALRPRHVWKYGRHPRLGEEKRRKIETTGQKYTGLPYYIGRP